MDYPTRFFNDFDFRTIKFLVKEKYPDFDFELDNPGLKHDALSDAINQTRLIQRMWKNGIKK